MNLPQDGDNELWREGFWLNHSKCHCQGQKGQVWLIFTYFSILISSIEVLPKCIVLHYVASQRWSWCCSQILIVLIDSNDYFQGQIGPIWTICYLFRLMFIWGTYTKVIYDLFVYLVSFDIGLALKVKSRSHAFQGCVTHKWCIIMIKVLWNTYTPVVSHILVWSFSLPYNIWPLIKLKGQIKVIGFSAGYI